MPGALGALDEAAGANVQFEELGLLKRFFYHEWLANTVVVKKKSDK